MELEVREPTINTLPHLSRHPNASHDKEQFWFKEHRNRVRSHDATRRWGSTLRKERVRLKVGKERVCIFIVWEDEMEMRCCLSTPGSAEYILPITLSTSFTPVSPYTRRRSLKMYLEAVIERVWKCTWRLWSCELAGRNRVSSEIHLAAVIVRTWRA